MLDTILIQLTCVIQILSSSTLNVVLLAYIQCIKIQMQEGKQLTSVNYIFVFILAILLGQPQN